MITRASLESGWKVRLFLSLYIYSISAIKDPSMEEGWKSL